MTHIRTQSCHQSTIHTLNPPFLYPCSSIIPPLHPSGKPITCEEERIATVLGCKWVDEVVRDVPYVMNDAYLQHIIETYQLDYIVHGDDPCIVDGKVLLTYSFHLPITYPGHTVLD